MVSPSQAEGDNFTMRPAETQQKELMCAEDRFWLWFWLIMMVGAVLLTATVSAAIIIYQDRNTPEKICADVRDPPEFCRELAKRKP